MTIVTGFHSVRVKNKPAWQAVRGALCVTFYAIGRGRRPGYWVEMTRDGQHAYGERVPSFYAAERKANELLQVTP